MKYTDLQGKCLDCTGIHYYPKDTMVKSTTLVGGDGHKNARIFGHYDINGEDYIEFSMGYFVKVDDLYNKDPFQEVITFSNQISYEIY